MQIDKAQQELNSRKLALDGAIADEAAAYAKLDELADNPKSFQSAYTEHQRLVLVRQRREREHAEAARAVASATRASKDALLSQLAKQCTRDALIALREPFAARLQANIEARRQLDADYTAAGNEYSTRLNRLRQLEAELGQPPQHAPTWPASLLNPA